MVVAGAGQAGFQVALSLRDKGFTGPLTLVGEEHGLPYQRPPLSKAYLAGAAERGAVTLRAQEFFDDRGIELRHGHPAVAIDTGARALRLASGAALEYAHLVLATGSRARVLDLPGTGLDGVLLLRTLADADTLRTRLREPARVVIVGGGFIGLETAAFAAAAGHSVTVVEGLDRVLARAVAPELSEHVAAVHRHHGCAVLLGRGVTAMHGDGEGRVSAVELTGGERIEADVVLVGAGVLPNVELAATAGLPVDDGIVVDERLRTADPRISAIGDCASYPSPYAGCRTRLESVQNAVDQARFLAGSLTGEEHGPYRAVPWFWTHQFDMKIQMAGIGGPGDERVVRGDPAQGRFSVFRFDGDRLVRVESVNRMPDHMAARRLLAGERRPGQEQVADPDFDLKAFAAG
ncbi:pyridine nucleotide-disulfide oxidoreductase [Amycolatopsis antarctica]|uniref:Pyridine nucleotide-disulfide oxidoreductase n=1 Tax=Amycolatopsis antarctica TaxID=1854586 RepID=A0A263D251_9PSEU|nr:pyridine nucleotide-disulfide oxidoreductase [Amycolatopsis antarctica]